MLILMILVLAGINYRVNAENENYGISTIEEGM